MIEDLSKIDVESLVPHKGPMCLIDSVVDAGEDWIIARAEIRADNMFVQDQGVPAWVGIEYMAQAVSALAGLRQRKNRSDVKLGFLLGTRKYSTERAFFEVGSVLQIKAQEVLLGENGLGAFQCEILIGEPVAQANLNVFQPANPQEFLDGGKW